MKLPQKKLSMSLNARYNHQMKLGKILCLGSRLKTFRSRLDNLVLQLLNIACGSQSPRIRQRIDRLGNRYYRVYDPSSETHRLFTSEEEMRVWLEERYYQ